jgi:hypothetical protein
MIEIFPNWTQRQFYPPIHGVAHSSKRDGLRSSTATAFFVDASHNNANDDNKGWDATYPLETIQEAVDKASAGDWIVVMSGTYDETVDVDKALTFYGSGGHASVIINPTTVGAVGMTISADDVKLINMSIFGEDTADYAVAIADGFSRISAYNCEFAGPDDNVFQITGAVNVLLQECSFSGGGNGIEIIDGAAVVPDAIYVVNCFFTDLTDAHIEGAATAVTRLVVADCIHDANVVPTKFFNVDGAGSTGIITGCRIAHATNATAVIDIAADIFWVANMTEAGVSEARPA